MSEQWGVEFDIVRDGYFGVCPTCHKHDGYVNVGGGHWFLCNEHRVMWFIGANLFSSWRDETEEEQRATFERLGLEAFECVKPFRDPSCYVS